MDIREHFRRFLEANTKENRKIRNISEAESDEGQAETEEGQIEPQLKSPTEVVYENEELRLIVQKSYFKKQKNFKLLDELFLFRIKQKNTSTKMPLLFDILEFLHASFLHVLDSIKSFYEKGTCTTITKLILMHFEWFPKYFCNKFQVSLKKVKLLFML